MIDLPTPRDIELKLDPPTIQAILDRGVAETVARAREYSAFYRETLAGCPEVSSVADLVHLPVTTKKQVSQRNRDFWTASPAQLRDITTTSGTTGEPTLYPLTAGDLLRLGENEQACFRRVGLGPGDVVLLAVTIDKCFMAGLAYFQGLQRVGATAVRVGAGSPAMLLSMAQRLKATAIVSVPSFLNRVGEFAREQGIDLLGGSVRKLICIGEPVRDEQFRLTALGENISRVWNAQVFSTYGVTELAASLCECTAGRGGHLNPWFAHVEILDDAGLPVPEGAIGQLVATTIGVEAMPMIRFATGDMTFMATQRCVCGCYTPRIGPILGRRDQAMKLKGTTVYPAAVQRSLQSIDSISDYILIATASAPLCDELEVVVSIRPGAIEAKVRELVCETLRGDLKVSPSVRIASTKEIAQLGASRELRKQRVFLDRRKQHA